MKKQTRWVVIVVIVVAIGIGGFVVGYVLNPCGFGGNCPLFEKGFVSPPRSIFCSGENGRNVISIVIVNTGALPLTPNDFITREIIGPSGTYVIQDGEFIDNPIPPNRASLIQTNCDGGCESGETSIRLATEEVMMDQVLVCP